MSSVPQLRPVALEEAKKAIREWHRHNATRKSWRWGCGVELDGKLVGVAMVGNPTSERYQRDPRILEVVRVAIADEARRQALGSKLYNACWRAAKALGCKLLVTYTRLDEDGASLVAASWVPTALVRAKQFHRHARSQATLLGIYAPAAEEVQRVRWSPRSAAEQDQKAVEALIDAHPALAGMYERAFGQARNERHAKEAQ